MNTAATSHGCPYIHQRFTSLRDVSVGEAPKHGVLTCDYEFDPDNAHDETKVHPQAMTTAVHTVVVWTLAKGRTATSGGVVPVDEALKKELMK